MSETAIAPPIPADADLRHMPGYMIDVQALLDSQLAAFGDPAANWFAVLSWCASLHQIPAGSLPDDDKELAWILRLGRDIKTWRKMRSAGALKGWIKHADGRLYHPMVTENVLHLLEKSKNGRRGGLASAKSREAAKSPQVAENTQVDLNQNGSLVEPDPNLEPNKGREGKGTEGKESKPGLSAEEQTYVPNLSDRPDGSSGQLALIETPPPKSKRRKGKPVVTPEIKAGFDAWWEACPLKVAKDRAFDRYVEVVCAGRASIEFLHVSMLAYYAAEEQKFVMRRYNEAWQFSYRPVTFLRDGHYGNQVTQLAQKAPPRSSASEGIDSYFKD